jgi:hypothetical protein
LEKLSKLRPGHPTPIIKTCIADVISILDIMTVDINEKLGQFLKEGQNWEKKPTNIQGVFLSINAATTGSTTKKKGIIIRSGSELEQINQLLSNPKLVELAKKIEAVNPKTKEDISTSGSDTDIFEI